MKLKSVILLVLGVSSVSCVPCSRLESVDITAGQSFPNGSIFHDDVEYNSNSWYEVEEEGEVIRLGCPCINRICLWKCCGKGNMFHDRTCNTTDHESVNPFNPPVSKDRDPTSVVAVDRFFYMYNRLCDSRYLVDSSRANEEVYIQQNASLMEVASGAVQWHPSTMFCVDMMAANQSEPPRLVALVCLQDSVEIDSPFLFFMYAAGLIISVPFLMATFIVYALIPELRNLHGMCLMAYCAGLIVAYPLLAYLKISVDTVGVFETGCLILAFVIYYAFQTSFFWLNVMCFDIWRTFSGYRGGTSSKRRENKRFCLYGLYAWGIPTLLTALTAAMQFADGIPDNIIRPNFAVMRCWFMDRSGEMVYFFTPVLILVVCNVVLFSITANRIRSIKQETAILKSAESSRSDKFQRDKQRYGLYLKLFIVMGVNWTVEVISFAFGSTNWYWILTDLCNLSLGIFIFIIFVWKNKVRMLIRKKISKLCGKKPEPGFSTGVTSSTGRWATRSSTMGTDFTRVSSDDAGVRLRDLDK